MRIYLLLSLLLGAANAFSQQYSKFIHPNKITINTPEQTIVAYTGDAGEGTPTSTSKVYYWYSGGQINSTQGGYSGKLLNGDYSVFYPNKNLKEQGSFKKGLKVGEWRAWYENGRLQEIAQWKKGVKCGDFSLFDEAGKLKMAGRFKSGLLKGKVFTYSGNDSVKVAYYKDGQAFVKKKSDTWAKSKKSVKKLGTGIKKGYKKILRKFKRNKPEKKKSAH